MPRILDCWTTASAHERRVSKTRIQEGKTMLSLRQRTRAVLALSMAAALFGLVEASPASAVPIGNVKQGKATYYNDAAFGACGTQIDAANQMLVAVPKKYWT